MDLLKAIYDLKGSGHHRWKIPNLEKGNQGGKIKGGLKTITKRIVKGVWEYLALKLFRM